VLLVVTGASFGFNLGTDRAPRPPAGLTFIRAGDINTRYLSWGKTGSPIVLVPGAFETADTFAALGEQLATDHRVLSFDVTGTGYSQPRSPFSADHLATQLLDFVTAMRLTGAVLVGHSSGAAVVGLAALRRPDLIAGVMFLDGDAAALPVPSFVTSLFIDPYRTTILRLGLHADWLVRRIYDSQCGPTCPRLNAVGVQLWSRPLQQPGTRSSVAFMLHHGIPRMTNVQLDQLRATPMPKSVVFGANDPQYGKAVPAQVASRIGAPTPTIVPGRHLTMIASPRAVGDAIRGLAARAVRAGQ
jgi:pimeloyl-ACP methyl ester carboxylesterase